MRIVIGSRVHDKTVAEDERVIDLQLEPFILGGEGRLKPIYLRKLLPVAREAWVSGMLKDCDADGRLTVPGVADQFGPGL